MKKILWITALLVLVLPIALHSQQDKMPTKPSDNLPPEIKPYLKIRALDHPGIGTYIVGLGDVNGDGFGDFAVSSTLDTTFIFFGGPNLDDQPDAFVLGGGCGVIAGDINGDKFPDIVTAQKDWYHRDTEIRGWVRIYLNTGIPPYYRTQPDFQIRGKNKFSGLAIGYGLLKGGDVNGDGLFDILVTSPNDKTPNGRGIVYLYLGSANPDTIPDFQFMDTHSGEARSTFGQKFTVGDFNQDGYDDIIIQGVKSIIGNITNHEVHLGNAQAQFGAPYKDVTNYQDPFRTSAFPWQFVDINGNNCSEIFPYSEDQQPPFTWGKCDVDFPLQTFMPDTAFPNPDPSTLGYGFGPSSIGKYNGTPYKEYVFNWTVPLIIDGLTNWLYQGGPGWQTKAIAYYGLRQLSDNVYGHPYPLGDVTGDILADFALISDAYNPDDHRFFYPIWIFKGDNQYKVTKLKDIYTPDDFSLSVYPNPVTSFDTKIVYLQGTLDKPSTVELSIMDILGRERLTISKQFFQSGQFQIPVEIKQLTNGQYFVVIKFDQRIIIRSLVVLTH